MLSFPSFIFVLSCSATRMRAAWKKHAGITPVFLYSMRGEPQNFFTSIFAFFGYPCQKGALTNSMFVLWNVTSSLCCVSYFSLKFWSCCQRKTTEFDNFLSQEGCTEGEHIWFKKDVSTGTNHKPIGCGFSDQWTFECSRWLSAAVAVWYWFAPVSASIRLGQTKPPFYSCSSDHRLESQWVQTPLGVLYKLHMVSFFSSALMRKKWHEITIEML